MYFDLKSCMQINYICTYCFIRKLYVFMKKLKKKYIKDTLQQELLFFIPLLKYMRFFWQKVTFISSFSTFKTFEHKTKIP